MADVQQTPTATPDAQNNVPDFQDVLKQAQSEQQPAQPTQSQNDNVPDFQDVVQQARRDAINPFSGNNELTAGQRIYVAQTAMGQVMKAFGHTWDAEHDDLTPETQEQLKKTGNYDDYIKGQKVTGNAFIDSTIIPSVYNMRNMATAWDSTKSAMSEFNNQFGGVVPAFAHEAATGAVPAAGGLAAFGVGAEAGVPLAPFAGPFAPIVPLITGTLASFGGTYATGAGQQKFLEAHPQIAEALGIDNDTLIKEAQKYPMAAFAGQLAPNLALMRPGSASIGQRVIGAGFMAGQEAAQEKLHGENLDPDKLALSAIMGAISNKNTRIGETLMGAHKAIYGTILDHTVPDDHIENLYSHINPIGDAKAHGGIELEDGEGIFQGTVLPTAEQEQNMQDAVNERGHALATFRNAATMLTEPERKIEPATQLSTGDIHTEARTIDPETFKAYDRLTAKREDLANRYQDLRQQRDTALETATSPYKAEIEAMQRELDKPTPPKKAASYPAKIEALKEQERQWFDQQGTALTPEMRDVTSKLQEVNGQLQDLAKTGKIAAAYSKAADRLSELNVMGKPETVSHAEFERAAETKPQATGQAPEAPIQAAGVTAPKKPEPTQTHANLTPEQAHDYVLEQTKKQAISSGVKDTDAQAAAEINAAVFKTLSERFGNTLGNAAQIYDKYGTAWQKARQSAGKELAQKKQGGELFQKSEDFKSSGDTIDNSTQHFIDEAKKRGFTVSDISKSENRYGQRSNYLWVDTPYGRRASVRISDHDKNVNFRTEDAWLTGNNEDDLKSQTNNFMEKLSASDAENKQKYAPIAELKNNPEFMTKWQELQKFIDDNESDLSSKGQYYKIWNKYERLAKEYGFGKDELKSSVVKNILSSGEENTLYQGNEKGSFTQLENGRGLIKMFEGKHDASTPIHEMGHHYLELLNHLSSIENAPKDLVDDMASIRKYLKNDGEPFTRAQHEKFARSFERYLMEGVAPNKSLARTFYYMKKMLTAIYETVKNLKAPITDDMRDVFDRLLERNPEKTVIAEDRDIDAIAKHMADIHEEDARSTPPEHADAGRDQIEKEIDRTASKEPEILNAIKTAETSANVPSEAGRAIEPATAVSGAERPTGEPSVTSSTQPEGGIKPSATSGGAGTAEPTGTGEPERVTAGNATGNAGIRQEAEVENGIRNNFEPTVLNVVHDDDSAIAAARDIYDQDPSLYKHRVVGDREVMQMALQGGKDLAEMAQLKQKLNELSEKSGIPLSAIAASYKAQIQQAVKEVREASANFLATPSEENAVALQMARLKFQSAGAQYSMEANQAGRTMRVFMRQIQAGIKNHQILELFQTEMGAMPDDLAAFAKAMEGLDENQAAKLTKDSYKPDFFDKLIWYRSNCLISGPITHARYMVGNITNAIVDPLIITPAQATADVLRVATGIQDERSVFYRESLPQLYALFKGSWDGLRTAGTAIANKLGADVDVYESSVGQKAAQAWREGQTPALAGQINKQFKGFQPTSTLGKLYATPSRSVGFLHAVTEQIRYEQNIAALSVRKALQEGLKPNTPEYNARVADLSSSPSGDMIDQATVRPQFSLKVQAEHIAQQEAADGKFKYGSKEYINRIDELVNNPTPQMQTVEDKANIIREAGRKARISAFMEPNAKDTFGSDLNNFVNKHKAAKLLVPFMKIDLAIQRQSYIEGTPLAFANKAIRDDLMGVNGDARASEAWGKMAVGTAVMGATAAAYMTGDINGDGPTDPKLRAVWLMDHKPNSIRIYGHFIPLTYLGIIGNQIRVIANMCDTIKYLKPDEDGDVHYMAAIESIIRGTLDEGWMGDIRQVMDALHDENGNAAKNFVQDYAASLSPWSVGVSQVSKATDPYIRQVRGFGEKLERQYPVLDRNLQPRVDVLGNDITGNAQDDPVTQRLEDLKIGVGRPKPYINNVKLNDQQYHDYQMYAGIKLKADLTNYVKAHPDVRNNPSAQYKDIVNKIKSSKAFARSKVLATYPELLRQSVKHGKAVPVASE